MRSSVVFDQRKDKERYEMSGPLRDASAGTGEGSSDTTDYHASWEGR